MGTPGGDIIGAQMGAAASKEAAKLQFALGSVALNLQQSCFDTQVRLYNEQVERMKPFLEQEMKKFAYEEEGWKFGLEQQDYARKGFEHG